ncbi:hypothetical protein AAW31_14540 [Nitrosomonas communis]|uniref:Uncharacterized protein n=2 Tax=Nitrosomonas communis TaxID=44574 RepID=A0A0F7KDZ0_9PROT|nr:hypothetical protein AAW31_14540 [Nitrosomonas communis]
MAKGRLESARLRSRRLCHIDIKSFQEKSKKVRLPLIRMGTVSPWRCRLIDKTYLLLMSTLGAEISYAISTKKFIPVIIPRLCTEGYMNLKMIAEALGLASSIKRVLISPLVRWRSRVRTQMGKPGFRVQRLFVRSIIDYIHYDGLIINHANNNII